MISRIYISHCEQDESFARELADALWAVDLESFSSVFKKDTALSQADLVSFGIHHSDCVVAILTKEGLASPRVNQEIGLSVGAGQLIIPLVEGGEELPFIIRHLRPIRFSKDTYEDALGMLIHTIRQLTSLEWLKTKCPHCGEEITQYLTPEGEVERAILAGTGLKTMCSYCEKYFFLNPKTFKPLFSNALSNTKQE